MTVGLLERKAEGQDYPGLRAVWARLMQRSHKTGIFYYPTTFDLGYGTAEERQRFAIWMLFSMACDLAQRPHPFMLRRDLESTRAELQVAAAAMRKTVQLGIRPPHTLGDDPQIDPLVVAAEEAEAMLDELDRVTVVKRDRGHLREQAVAVSIARMTYLLFGKLLPSVAATLTSVLLGQQVTPRQVREWWELAAGKSRRRAKRVKR